MSNPQETQLTSSSHIARRYWATLGMRWMTLYGPTEVGAVKDSDIDIVLEQM